MSKLSKLERRRDEKEYLESVTRGNLEKTKELLIKIGDYEKVAEKGRCEIESKQNYLKMIQKKYPEKYAEFEKIARRNMFNKGMGVLPENSLFYKVPFYDEMISLIKNRNK